MKQACILFRINDIEEAHRVVLSALKAFQHSSYNRATDKSARMDLVRIVELLPTNTDDCLQDVLVSVLRNAFQFARSRGRDEVLKYIAVFAASLSKLGVITQTWERIQAVEALFHSDGHAILQCTYPV